MTRSLRRVRISLDLPHDVPGIIIRAMFIADSMDGNHWFPTPVPSLAAVRAAIAVLQSAQAAAGFKTYGLASQRDVELGKVKLLLDQLKAYVQGIAQGNLAYAASIVESAGMRYVTSRLPESLDLKATVDVVHGVVHLEARSAGDHVIYYWQMSADGGTTWTDQGQTGERKKSLTGLTRGKPYQFRVRADTPKLSKLWSAPVGVLIP